MKAMIAMNLDRERKESEFIWDGELNASGRRESNAISWVHLKCRMLAVMMHDSGGTGSCDAVRHVTHLG